MRPGLMFRFAISTALLVCLLAASRPARAEEPYLEFLAALRDAGMEEHFEAAGDYLDMMEKRTDLPARVRDVLSFERGLTLLAHSRRVTSEELQRRLLNDAEAALGKFTREHPQHPLAGEANYQKASLILQKAWVEIFAALEPANAASRMDLQAKGRSYADKAKEAFATAQKQLKTELDKYPVSETNLTPEQKITRPKIEARLLNSSYESAMCAYATAQSYRDPEVETQSQLFKNRIKDAAAEFEKHYERYQQQLIGRYGRLMQAKCLEELDDLRPALGIYDELLDRLADGDPAIDVFKDKVLFFRLSALNHPTRKEYAIVEGMGSDWMLKHKERARTSSGYGIAYELAIALKELAKADDISATRKTQLLARAQELAATLVRSTPEFRSKGIMLQREVSGLRNRAAGPIRTFAEAMTEADGLQADLAGVREAYAAAVADGDSTKIAARRKALFEQADKLVGVYDQGLLLADNTADPKQVGAAQTRLAYAYFLQEKYLEAATVADYQVLKFHTGPYADAAKESAYVAIVALDILYRRTPRDDRQFEREALERAAANLLRRWPESERASDVRLILGSLQFDNGDYLQAIQEWGKIKEGSGQFGTAEVKIGSAGWQQYAVEASRDPKDRPSADELSRRKADAIRHLENGIAVLARGASGTTAPPDLILGKLTLAVIRNQEGVYTSRGNVKGARELLTEPPYAVVDAVEVPRGEKRPRDATDPRSRQMASYTYQQLLKTYIGMKDLEKAQAARMKLEEVAAGDDAEALTRIFVDFGRELQNQLQQLQAQGETARLAEVREGFESFLTDIQKRSEGHDWNTRLWIAETFSSLGESATDNEDAARGYFAKAAESYRQMLDEPGKAPGPDYVSACRLQLARVYVRGKEFSKAEDAILEVIKQKSAIGSQLAAADLYRSWGEAENERSKGDAAKKFQTAAYGEKGPLEIWGYNRIFRDLQRMMLNEGDESTRERLDSMRIETRYREAQSLRQLGLLQQTDDDRITILNRAAKAVMAVAGAKLPRPEHERFNSLFLEIQSDLGLVPVDLAKSGDVKLVDPKQKRAVPPAASDVPTAADGSIPSSKANVAVIAGMIVVGLIAVGGILFFANQQQKQQLNKLAQLAAGSSAPGGDNSPPGRRSRPGSPASGP